MRLKQRGQNLDIALSYQEYGRGEPLLLLHGNGENGRYFQKQIACFAEHWRVIALDTRGHGRSPRGTAPFTLAQFAQDLRDFMEERHIERAHLLGFSDGGNIALLFALRWPQRVNRLILTGANLFPSGLKALTLLQVDAAYAALAPLAPLSTRARRKMELLRLMAREPDIDPHALARLALPVLVIAGTRDVIREEHTRLISDSLPCGQLRILPSGHNVAQENPEAFNRAVLEFLLRSE